MNEKQNGRAARRRYTAQEKKEILATARATSVAEASKRHGCPATTIHTWIRRDGKNTAAIETANHAPEETPPQGDHRMASKGRRYSPAEKKRILEYASKEGIIPASRKFGCSDFTIRRWIKKTRVALPEAVEEKPDLSAEQEERHRRVLKVWRDNPGFGPSQVRNQLKREGYKVSVHTVTDIMTEGGYIQPKVNPKEPGNRYEAVRPRQLYHLDFLHFRVHKERQCLLLVEDDFSRFIAGWVLLRSEHARGVIETFDTAVLRYGKPEGVMVDRGSAFYSFRGVAKFERHITDDGIDYYPIDEPRKNGKLERLNYTVRKELLTQVEFADLQDAEHRIGVWVHQYNYRRTHMALGGLLVPADRFHGMAEEALKRIEHGNPASPFELLVPGDRALEIFRVVSIAGQPAVYLMGKRLL